MMFDALKKYAVFTGRSRRKEFAFFILLYVIAVFVASILDKATSIKLFSFIVALGFLIPFISVTIRRLHDTDRVGWWILIALIPVIGPIALLVICCLDGTPGNNRFGPNPKA